VHGFLNFKSRLPDATQDDVLFVPQAVNKLWVVADDALRWA
jgi:hypothetical protein